MISKILTVRSSESSIVGNIMKQDIHFFLEIYKMICLGSWAERLY